MIGQHYLHHHNYPNEMESFSTVKLYFMYMYLTKSIRIVLGFLSPLFIDSFLARKQHQALD